MVVVVMNQEVQVDLVVDHHQRIVVVIILDKVQVHNLHNQESLEHMDLVIQVVDPEMVLGQVKLQQVVVVQEAQGNEDNQTLVVLVVLEEHIAFLVLQ